MPNATGTGSRLQGTIDLGAYVDVGDQQALAIEQVDVIHQVGTDFGTDYNNMLAADGSLTAQLTDLNPGTLFVRADDNSLIASSSLNIGVSENIGTAAADFFPDTFGKLDQSRLVVNDQLYVVVGNDGAGADIGGSPVYITMRVKARIVKVSTKDWMAIAIQSTASDN
jgi:hypothetical protein